jgi:hypothetical protein
MKSIIGTAALAASVVACLILSGVSVATATTLDPVSFGSPFQTGLNAVAENQGDPKSITDFGAYTSSSTVNQATAQAGAILSGGIDPAISATIEAAAGSSAHDPTGTGATVFAGVQLIYQFVFNGPAANVPMIVGANYLKRRWLKRSAASSLWQRRKYRFEFGLLRHRIMHANV